MSSERESMEFDVLIVGAGPAGLAAAIRLKQQAAAAGSEISVCVIEKGAEVGAHILSGAVMDPRALEELLPDWKALGAPLDTPVREDKVLLLQESGSRQIPHALLPDSTAYSILMWCCSSISRRCLLILSRMAFCSG